jgi:phage terminase large subunit-like protein
MQEMLPEISPLANEFKDIPLDVLLRSFDNALAYHEDLKRKKFAHYFPNEKQSLFHKLGASARERLLLGANRSGKTICASFEIAMHVTGIYPDWWVGYRYEKPIQAWVCGVTELETYQILEKKYIDGFGDDVAYIAPDLITSSNRQSHIYQIWHSSGGVSTLRFKSYKQGREAFQGEKIHVLHLDEEPPLDVYSEGVMRTMSTAQDHYGMVLLTMTPLKGVTNMLLNFMEYEDAENLDEGGRPVIRKRSPEEVKHSRCYMMISWEDTTHLANDEKARMLANMPLHEREARSKGVPSLGSGMVYPISESSITCEPFQIPEYWARVFGLDFGWTDPTAALFAAHDRDNDEVYFYAEYAASQLTPQHHAVELMKQNAHRIPGVFDESGKSSMIKDGSRVIDLYKEAGIKNMTPADRRREEGVLLVLQRMQNGKLKIFNTLHKTLAELRMYARDEKGLIKDGNDHLMDCMRYVIKSGLTVARPDQRVLSKLQIPLQQMSGGGGWMNI